MICLMRVILIHSSSAYSYKTYSWVKLIQIFNIYRTTYCLDIQKVNLGLLKQFDSLLGGNNKIHGVEKVDTHQKIVAASLINIIQLLFIDHEVWTRLTVNSTVCEYLSKVKPFTLQRILVVTMEWYSLSNQAASVKVKSLKASERSYKARC